MRKYYDRISIDKTDGKPDEVYKSGLTYISILIKDDVLSSFDRLPGLRQKLFGLSELEVGQKLVPLGRGVEAPSRKAEQNARKQAGSDGLPSFRRN